MTKQPTVTIKFRTSGWVSVQSANALPATYAFMFKAAKHMDRVCFGDEYAPNTGTPSIKVERLPRFLEYAAKCGITVERTGA